MPPKISFNREDIIQAALDVVREYGFKELTVRKIAEKMKGSTQPIYREFKTIEELEVNVIKEAEAIALKYMLEAEDTESSFLSVGTGYLEFAKKEPGLFHLLYMSGKKKFDFDNPEWPFDRIIEKMKKDSFLNELDTDILINLIMNMRIYAHGLCTIASITSEKSETENHRQLLHNMGEKLIIYELLKSGGKINFDDIKRRFCDESNHS